MASATQNTGHLCPSGRHTMDPNWKVCPYCDGENRSRQQTAHPKPELVKSTSSRKTSISSSPAPNIRRETRPMQENNPQSSFGGSGGQGDTRRIVGILITYSWLNYGDIFKIREGKNYIGAGNVSREPGDPPCEIQITTDQKLSSAHALILCRNNVFEILDLASSNGTYLDGKMVPTRGADLPDNAIIKTGSTEWTFMKIQPVEGESHTNIIEPEIKPKNDKPDRPKTIPR